MGPVLPLAQQNPVDLAGWLTGSAVTVLAFIVVAFISGWIVPGRVHQRVLTENDELKTEARALQAVFFDKVIPTLTRATDVIARTAERERGS